MSRNKKADPSTLRSSVNLAPLLQSPPPAPLITPPAPPTPSAPENDKTLLQLAVNYAKLAIINENKQKYYEAINNYNQAIDFCHTVLDLGETISSKHRDIVKNKIKKYRDRVKVIKDILNPPAPATPPTQASPPANEETITTLIATLPSPITLEPPAPHHTRAEARRFRQAMRRRYKRF